MPRFPKARKRPDNTPAFLTTAKGFYGEAFGPRRKADLAESIADWAELTEEEQSFALAHLQYLNLIAQAGTQRLLLQVRELLAEIEDGVSEALDEAIVAVEPEEELAGDDEMAGFEEELPDDLLELPEVTAIPDEPVEVSEPESSDAQDDDESEDDDELADVDDGGGA